MNNSPEAVAQAIAQVRKWQTSADNGWAPSRKQCGVLADELERLRAIEQRAREVLANPDALAVDPECAAEYILGELADPIACTCRASATGCRVHDPRVNGRARAQQPEVTPPSDPR